MLLNTPSWECVYRQQYLSKLGFRLPQSWSNKVILMQILVFSMPKLMKNEGVLRKPLSSTTFSSTHWEELISIQWPCRMETSICFKWDFVWLLFLFWKSNCSFLSHIIMSFLITIVTLYCRCKGELTYSFLQWNSVINKIRCWWPTHPWHK